MSAQPLTALRDRVKDLRRVKASDLLPHPENWRTHPVRQREALSSVLAEVGIADALLVRETEQGLQLIDGHLRAEMEPDSEWPVLVLDVTEQEARTILATHDPLAAMAETNQRAFNELQQRIGTVPDLPKIKMIDLPPVPRLGWWLIGIPLERAGEIRALIDQIAAVEGVITSMTVSDG